MISIVQGLQKDSLRNDISLTDLLMKALFVAQNG